MTDYHCPGREEQKEALFNMYDALSTATGFAKMLNQESTLSNDQFEVRKASFARINQELVSEAENAACAYIESVGHMVDDLEKQLQAKQIGDES